MPHWKCGQSRGDKIQYAPTSKCYRCVTTLSAHISPQTFENIGANRFPTLNGKQVCWKKCSISLLPWENKDTWLQLCWWLTTYLFLWIFQSGCNLWCIIISYECYENCETVFACIADHLLNLLHFLTLCTRQRDPFYKTNAHALKKAIGFI